jgi:hypothetical protein
MDLGYVVDPGTSVFEIDDAPGEGTGDDPVEAAADGNAGAVLGLLDRPGAAHGIVRQSSIAVIPLFREQLFERQVVDFLRDFPSAEHELAKGREAVRCKRSVAESAAIEKRISADVVGGLMHDETAADFGENLPLRVDACGAGSTTADTRAATEERFVIRKGGKLDVGFLGTRVSKFDAIGLPSVFYVEKGFLAVSVLVVLEKSLAEIIVGAEKTETCVAVPGHAKRHHVGEGSTGIQKASHQDDGHAIGGAIFNAHDDVAVSDIFGQHGAETESRGVDEGDKSGRSVKHDVADGSFTGWTNFPLGMPDGGVRHGTEHADPILSAVAPLDETVVGIILAFDKTKDRTFDGMANVRGHEVVAVAPATKLGDRAGVIPEPMAVQRITSAGFGSDVKSVHDPGVKQGLPKSGLPAEV